VVRVARVPAGLASNLYAMGAQDKVVQRILHSKPHVTRERYIKVFDRTVLEAVEKVQMRIEELRRAKGGNQQLQLKFGDGLDLPATLVAENPSGGGFRHSSAVRSAVGQQSIAGSVVSC
jgi:hypothetical protein